MKEKNILKVSNYDKFKCTADKCKFTCCEGWDISIDNSTYDRWSKGSDSKKLLNGVKFKSCNGNKEYFINKEPFDVCPLLDEKGLCTVVKNHGEKYLSLTCHTFPRIENNFGYMKELSLSCACPEVINIISDMNRLELISDEVCQEENLFELKIRQMLLNIISQKEFQLDEKLLVSYEILLSILEELESKEITVDKVGKYSDKNYIKALISIYIQLELNRDESIEEITYLFLDVIENYKEVEGLKGILENISDYAENISIEVLEKRWNYYKDKFKVYDNLLEKCIVSKIISNCVNEELREIVVAFQMIILEYLLVRYSVFLKYCMEEKEELDIEDIKDYIVTFSRIIGNNSETVREFIKEGFEDELLELGYLCFIGLF